MDSPDNGVATTEQVGSYAEGLNHNGDRIGKIAAFATLAGALVAIVSIAYLRNGHGSRHFSTFDHLRRSVGRSILGKSTKPVMVR